MFRYAVIFQAETSKCENKAIKVKLTVCGDGGVFEPKLKCLASVRV